MTLFWVLFSINPCIYPWDYISVTKLQFLHRVTATKNVSPAFYVEKWESGPIDFRNENRQFLTIFWPFFDHFWPQNPIKMTPKNRKNRKNGFLRKSPRIEKCPKILRIFLGPPPWFFLKLFKPRLAIFHDTIRKLGKIDKKTSKIDKMASWGNRRVS